MIRNQIEVPSVRIVVARGKEGCAVAVKGDHGVSAFDRLKLAIRCKQATQLVEVTVINDHAVA